MRRNKEVLVACMCAALAFAIASDATIATAGPGMSASAKKRCTKKHASKKKKKKCNQNRKSAATRSPVIRATLTWGNGAADDVDMDLFVFDADGNAAGDGSDTIPMSSITPDFSGRAGFEQFTDSL